MDASAERPSIADWEAKLAQRRTAAQPVADLQAGLRRQFSNLAQQSKAQNQSPYLGRNGIACLDELRKPALGLMLLAHQELAAYDRADVLTVPEECLKQLLDDIAARLTELDACLDAIRAARLTADLAGPAIAELATGRELPAKRFRPVLDQLLSEEKPGDLATLAPLSALRWNEPDVAPNPMPAWFWAAAVPAARWTAALTRDEDWFARQTRESKVLAALLADIGQLVLAASQQRGRAASAGMYQRHPEVSAALIAGLTNSADASMLAGQHHERIDGSGFPRKLSRRQLCLAARLIAVIARWTELLKAKASAAAPADALSAAAFMLWKETLAGGFDESLVRDFLAAIRPDLPATVQRAVLNGTWMKVDAAHETFAGPHREMLADTTDEVPASAVGFADGVRRNSPRSAELWPS